MRCGLIICLLLTLAACEAPTQPPHVEAIVPFAADDEPDLMLQPEPPDSVVIVLVDALRPDWLGAYGSGRQLTPELDRLADSSFVFENAYATSAWTRSSIGSLFTARYPSSHTALTRDDALPQRSVTLAETLESRARFWSFGITTNPNAGPAIGFDQGFDYFGRPDSSTARGYAEDALRLIPAEAVTQHALELFDRRPEEDRFVLAFVHYIDPHDPYMPHPGLLDIPEPDGPLSGSRVALDALRKLGTKGGTDENIARLEYLYAGEVRYTDHWIGELLRGFQERGVFDDMLLIVTADHGEAFFEHGKRGHGQSLYEPQIRVPLLIKLPGMQAGDGRRIAQPVSLADVAPTVLEAWGIDAPPDFQGGSLGPLLFGLDRAPAFDYVFFELQINPDARRFGLRHGDFKIIRNAISVPDADERVFWELFYLADDPREQTNLINEPAHASTQTRLENALLQWEDAVQRAALTPQPRPLSELDEETLKELRGLGYIQ